MDLPVPHVHYLDDLYDKIPSQVRALIEDVYNTKWPEQARQLCGRISFTVAKGPQKEPRWESYRPSLALPDLLSRSRDLFHSWRYIFEFTQPKDSPYQFHQFEYGLLWCAAEAIRIEVTVRLRGTGGASARDSAAGESWCRINANHLAVLQEFWPLDRSVRV